MAWALGCGGTCADVCVLYAVGYEGCNATD